MRHFRELFMISLALPIIGVLVVILSNRTGEVLYLVLAEILGISGAALFAFAAITRQMERAAVWDLPAPGYLDVILFDEKNQ
jgi:hypothetical protein